MNPLVEVGRKRTIIIAISILLVSIHTIYYYHSFRPEIETKKLVQQIIRFSLTVGLLYMIYKGKTWAIIIATILFSLAILGALFAIFTTEVSLISKIPFFVMIFVYSMAVYHFAISKSFKAFTEYQRGE